VPFIIFLKSFDVLLYEIMSWAVFYPRMPLFAGA
jgi:hypothetical protein